MKKEIRKEIWKYAAVLAASFLSIAFTWVITYPETEADKTEYKTEAEETSALETEVEVTETSTEEIVVKETLLCSLGYDGVKYEMSENLVSALIEELDENGISWFLPFAVAECWQESAFGKYTVSFDGKDIGLFQYRAKFWDDHCLKAVGETGLDINDPVTQIRVYCAEMGKRINGGMSIEEAISCHYSGGNYYAEEYVMAVKGWLEYIIIRKEVQ